MLTKITPNKMNLNKAMVIGRLTRDPEVKALSSGTHVASFSLATNHTFKDKDGKKQEVAEFINVVVFGMQAENAGQYLKKGQEAYVEGRIQTRSWDAEDGTKRYRVEIVADRVQFGAKTGSTEGGAEAKSYAKPEQQRSNVKVDSSPIEYPTEDINPEDIPF